MFEIEQLKIIFVMIFWINIVVYLTLPEKIDTILLIFFQYVEESSLGIIYTWALFYLYLLQINNSSNSRRPSNLVKVTR